MPIRTVGWYLQRWRFTPQKPVRRAYERNPAAVQQWLERDYLRLRAEARRQRGEIHWGDEMGLRRYHQKVWKKRNAACILNG